MGAKEKDNLWVKEESNCKKLTVCGGASIAAYEVKTPLLPIAGLLCKRTRFKGNLWGNGEDPVNLQL